MKHDYISPTMEAIEVDYKPLMLTASADTDYAGVGDNSADDSTPDLSDYRRGSWGNRWE